MAVTLGDPDPLSPAELQHRPGDTVIAIQPGAFYDCVMPENVQRWAGRLFPDPV